jgi:hypothetical protein
MSNLIDYDELYAELMRNRIKKPQLIPKPTPQQKAEARFNERKKPTEAILQDATAAANAVAQRFGAKEWLEQERLKREEAQRAWDAEQHRLATDGHASRNYLRAYRRQSEAIPGPIQQYNSLCEQTVRAIDDAQRAMRNARISFTKGPGDPDW